MGHRKLLMLGMATVVLCGCGGTNSARVPGRWGSLIACLRNHPLLAVYDATSGNASSPTARTNALDVWQDVKGVALAYIGNNAMGADDLTGSGAVSVNLIDGPIHFGFNPQADTQNRFDVESCVRRAYPSKAGSPRGRTSPNPARPSSYGGIAPNANYGPATDQSACRGTQVSVGPATSCGFAMNVAAAVAAAHRATGHFPANVTAHSPATGRSYSLHCSILGYGSELVCATVPPATGIVVVSVKAPAPAAQIPTPSPSVPQGAISAVGPALSLIFCGSGTSPVGEAFNVHNALVTAEDLVTECGSSGIVNGSNTLSVSRYDSAHDLAALAPVDVSAAATLETSTPQVGEKVALVGDFPGTSMTLSAVVESASSQVTIELPGTGSATVSGAITVLVRGSMPLGNIGGPAIDAGGNVVGVAIGYNAATHEAFLAPASDVAALIR